MELFIYKDVFLSESNSAANAAPKGIANPPAMKQRPKGNVRHHAKALFKANKVEHNINYSFNPPKVPKPIGMGVIKQLTKEIGEKLLLMNSMSRTFNLTLTAANEFRFSFIAFGFDEGVVLKTVELFDKIMMEHGWDALVISITKLDGSAERVDFCMKTTARYSGMSFDLNQKLL
jgi:hypothetical protein